MHWLPASLGHLKSTASENANLQKYLECLGDSMWYIETSSWTQKTSRPNLNVNSTQKQPLSGDSLEIFDMRKVSSAH